MAISKAAAHHRARVAALSRDRRPDDPDLLDARRDLHAERLAERVAQVVAELPPLTVEQRERIATLLRPFAVPDNDRQAAVQARLAELDGGGNNAA
jgi:hypothetical protein